MAHNHFLLVHYLMIYRHWYSMSFCSYPPPSNFLEYLTWTNWKYYHATVNPLYNDTRYNGIFDIRQESVGDKTNPINLYPIITEYSLTDSDIKIPVTKHIFPYNLDSFYRHVFLLIPFACLQKSLQWHVTSNKLSSNAARSDNWDTITGHLLIVLFAKLTCHHLSEQNKLFWCLPRIHCSWVYLEW